MVAVKSKNEYGVSLDEAVDIIRQQVSDAITYMKDAFSDHWENSEKYFNGGTSVENVNGHSTAVVTVLRDAVRNCKPSVMRTLLHSTKIVDVMPGGKLNGPLAEQQALYLTQFFWSNNGYMTLLSSVEESFKKKFGPVKVYYEENPESKHNTATGLTQQDYQMLVDDATCEVLEVEERQEGEGVVYDVKWLQTYPQGSIRMEAFPANEFFISPGSTSCDSSPVHGHYRTVTVAEAIQMGIDYDDWEELDDDDPKNDFIEEETERTNSLDVKNRDSGEIDITAHEFTLTEVYCRVDLEGTGEPCKYLFYLGGSSCELLHHEKIDDWCIALVEHDPTPFSAVGRSFFDILSEDQDNLTSLLRATIDNGHISNNPRPIYNPMLVKDDTMLSGGIGAPIHIKQGGTVEWSVVPFTGDRLLAISDRMTMAMQNKIGITAAAQGLDPNAMQSTDKDAVKNTIMLAQGQVELMVRNIIETGVVAIFRMLLKLSMKHLDKVQLVRMKGQVIPVMPGLFDPDFMFIPRVGLGTTAISERRDALLWTLAKQEQMLQGFGMDNPMVGLSNIYNTIEDIQELMGLYDTGRYFKIVTPEIEAQLAKQRAEMQNAQAKNAPADPSKVAMAIEDARLSVKQQQVMADARNAEKDRALKALTEAEKLDIERDKMEQEKQMRMAEMRNQRVAARTLAETKKAQSANDKDGIKAGAGKIAAE
jgi:hypothetical protein